MMSQLLTSISRVLPPAIVALYLIVLHRVDGGDVTINAEQVTTLRSTAGVGHLVDGHCVIGLTDGKFVAVLEACAEVKRQLEKKAP